MTVGFFGAKGDSWIRMVFLVLSFLSAIGGPHLIESKRVKGKKFWEIVASILEIFEVDKREAQLKKYKHFCVYLAKINRNPFIA